MDPLVLDRWFADNSSRLEASYLGADTPWQQSGFSGPVERWTACRRAVADCIDAHGTFLDIGCANGYLLECLLEWTAERGIAIVPYGLDISEKLVTLARKRIPGIAGNLYTGNAWHWRPPRLFDFVRTELIYVPQELQRDYVLRIQRDMIAPGGRLLVCEYRSRRDDGSAPWVDEVLRGWGMPVASSGSGMWEGKELTRAAVMLNAGSKS